MTNKTYGIIEIATPILFLTLYLIMSSIRPEYSMFTKAISELGSVDVPKSWIWNCFGYILTGLLIAIYPFGLYKNMAIEKSNKLPL